jgi:hypothetical protein
VRGGKGKEGKGEGGGSCVCNDFSFRCAALDHTDHVEYRCSKSFGGIRLPLQ